MENKIIIKSKHHDIINSPVALPINRDIKSSFIALKDGGGNIIPAQITEKGGKKYVVFIVSLEKGEEKAFEIIEDYKTDSKVELRENPESKSLDIFLENKLFTNYVYDEKFAKPYLGPIFNKKGESYTRLDFSTKEHPHHRSVYLGIGEVNGIDFWNEPQDMGLQRHQNFENKEEGPVFGAFTAENIWCDLKENPIMREKRRITVYNNKEESRFIDIEFTFFADYSDIVFGATKEAGPLGIRLNEALKVENTGTMTNSYGAINEDECWGKPAQWCDYSGVLNGDEYGIAVFDNPLNERYPTCWHIRDYGLFAPNNLYFRGGLNIKKGDSLTYKYRICFHEGNVITSRISEKFLAYINF